jgi:ppGpp synthetase/RelA/SpoT-type nucleotidyltranferase
MLSGNAVKALGKRLRGGNPSAADLDLLDSYRSEFDGVLLDTAQTINRLMAGRPTYLMAGRMKRTKSIIRKLSREANGGMDLSRMSDIVGLRLVTTDLEEQNSILKTITQNISLARDPYDYRHRETGYRAIHLIAGSSSHRVEIQVRTIAQHLWADESERLGEQVKEGRMGTDTQRHLDSLCTFTKTLDSLPNPTSLTDFTRIREHPIDVGREQEEWFFAYQRLGGQLKKAALNAKPAGGSSFVVVYHQPTNSLIRIEKFGPNDRLEAIDYFRTTSRSLDESLFDILVLNSPSGDSLAVTHPRYFPEGLN